MFDIGFSEMVLVAVIALVVLGPERLPKAMRFVGQIVGKMRGMASSLKNELNQQIEQSELKEVAETMKETAHAMHEQVSGSLNEIKQEFHHLDEGRDAWQNLPPMRSPEDFAEPKTPTLTPSLHQKSRQLRKNTRPKNRTTTRLRARATTKKSL